MLDAVKLKNRYIKWLNGKTFIHRISDDVIRIDMPFLDNFNDQISMYAIKKGYNIIFTDDGWTLDNLESLGITLRKNSYKRNLIISQLNTYGVTLNENNEMTVECSIKDFPEFKQRFMQAILFVNDMFVFAPKKSKNIFIDDVDDFLNDNGIRALKQQPIIGVSGLTHMYSFLIPGLRKKRIPNKYIKTISEANNSLYAKAAFADVEETRPKLPKDLSKFYVFLNDVNKNHHRIKVNEDILNLFEDHNIKPCLYTQRNKYIKELAA